MPATVRVEGLRELSRAFARLSDDLKMELRSGLREAAEPVREEAEHEAVRRIRKIGSVWSRMRLGVTMAYVYVAPATRRRRGTPRPMFGTLLFKAMLAAAEQKENELVRRLERLLDRLEKREGF